MEVPVRWRSLGCRWCGPVEHRHRDVLRLRGSGWSIAVHLPSCRARGSTGLGTFFRGCGLRWVTVAGGTLCPFLIHQNQGMCVWSFVLQPLCARCPLLSRRYISVPPAGGGPVGRVPPPAASAVPGEAAGGARALGPECSAVL